MTHQFEELNDGDRFALFVNSDSPPDIKTPLSQYAYKEDGSKIYFFRLYKVSYNREIDGFIIPYHTLQWYPIEIKDHCRSALKFLIDSMKGAEYFIV